MLPYEPSPFDPAPIPFDRLSLDARLLSGIRDLGWTETRSIQSGVIPFALAGSDVIACAETGTGRRRSWCRSSSDSFMKRRRSRPGPGR